MHPPRPTAADVSASSLFKHTTLLRMCPLFYHFAAQETHRVKLVVGAIEVALEQETILAVLRIASSVLVDSPPPHASSLVTLGAVVSSGSMSVPATPRSRPCAEAETGVLPAEAGGSDGGGGGLAMPMLPCGVSVTLAVDFAAMSVVLTNARRNVIAVTFGAAHCKVNVSELIVCLGYGSTHTRVDIFILPFLRVRDAPPRVTGGVYEPLENGMYYSPLAVFGCAALT